MVNDSGGGTTVTANPEGTDGDPITRIAIDGTNYNFPAGESSEGAALTDRERHEINRINGLIDLTHDLSVDNRDRTVADVTTDSLAIVEEVPTISTVAGLTYAATIAHVSSNTNTVIVAKVPVDDSQFDYDFTLTTSGGDEYTHGLNSFTEIPVDGDFAYYYHSFTFPIQLTGTAKLVKATITPVSTTFRGNLSLRSEQVLLSIASVNGVGPTDATFAANTISVLSPSGGTASLLAEGSDTTTITINEAGFYSVLWSATINNTSPNSTRAMPEMRLLDSNDNIICVTPYTYIRYTGSGILIRQECSVLIPTDNFSIKAQNAQFTNRLAIYATAANTNYLRFTKLR